MQQVVISVNCINVGDARSQKMQLTQQTYKSFKSICLWKGTEMAGLDVANNFHIAIYLFLVL